MGQSALKIKNSKAILGKKRADYKLRAGDPIYTLDRIADLIKTGDIENITDVISSYIINSPKYSSHEAFAEAIGTSRATLLRMLAHNDAVSIKVFFSAMGRVYSDSIT